MTACGQKMLVACVAGLAFAGCTSVVVKKDPGDHDKGFRYYMPKPYLFIGPTTTTTTEKEGAKSTTTKPVTIEIKHLPDYEEKYSVRLKPGVGKGKLEVELENGWNLTKVGLETDQQLDEIIKSTADLVGSIGSIAKGQGFGPSGGMTILANTNVPFGFYEPVFAKTPRGRKIFAWKYVGVLPYGGPSLDVVDDSECVAASSVALYGLTSLPDGMPRFEQLDQMYGKPEYLQVASPLPVARTPAASDEMNTPDPETAIPAKRE